MHPLRRLKAPFRSPAFDLARLNAELQGQPTVGLAVVARHETQSTACTRNHEPVHHSTPVIVASMHKHHTARPFLPAGAGLLTAFAPHAWPLITGSLQLTALAIVVTLLASGDERTPFERMVALLCIVRRIDPRPYLRLSEPARRKRGPGIRAEPGTSIARCRKGKPKTLGWWNTGRPTTEVKRAGNRTLLPRGSLPWVRAENRFERHWASFRIVAPGLIYGGVCRNSGQLFCVACGPGGS